MGTYAFVVRLEFDWLMNYPEARAFEGHVGSTFVSPPFGAFGFAVDPPIRTADREVDVGWRYGTAKTTTVRVEGDLHATAPDIARALLRRSCEALWWHARCRRRVDAELDGVAFVIDLTIPAHGDLSPAHPPEPLKPAGRPPRAFVAHRWSSIPEMSDATVLAVALSTCGYDVTMDQLDTRGTYVDRVDDQAIADYVAQITACHLFLYVSTAAFESDAQRKWLAAERATALREAAELRIQLAAVVMHDTLDPADRFADVLIDGRAALAGGRTPEGNRSGDTGELQRRLRVAGLGYGGPRLDPPLRARLAEVVETVAEDVAGGRLEHADRTLSASHDTLGYTEEWQLACATFLAAAGAPREAATMAANLLQGPTAWYPTRLGACDVLEGLALVRPALREWARVLRIFLSPARAELRGVSHTYARARASMARLLAAMGESDGARAHAAAAAPATDTPRPRGCLACDVCSASYRPQPGAPTVVCEACGGHGALHGDGCVFCGGERRFVVDQVSAGRPCPVCGVGAVRWS
jgi:hypothetical protein